MDNNSEDISIKVLVVEDNRTQREYLRYILEKKGYIVEIVQDGDDALSRVKEICPGIILTDIIMPRLDGYELCRRIKEDADTHDIPVILVTHLFNPVDVVKGLESGADNFIIKPFDPETIQAKIESTIEANKPDPGIESCEPLILTLSGETYTITAGRLKILHILLSTYETAVKNNVEMQEMHEQLNYLNTELKKAVSELQASNEELCEENNERVHVEEALGIANKKLQLMTRITRHDLLNQLHSIQGYLELAESEHDTDPSNAWSYLAKIQNIVNQTINTISFTGEYQEIGIKSPIWQNIHTVLTNSLRHVSLSQVKLTNLLPHNMEIYADPLIEKVFSNLIDNSLRYGDGLTFVRFSFVISDRKKMVIFEDDGVGIPEYEKEMIFSFKYGKNTGQGLFLSREILSITGITIEETGVVGNGARFEITFPDDSIRIE